MKSAGKVMARLFWDTRGIMYTDYLEKGQTITGAYYVSLLRQLSKKIKKKHPHLKKKAKIMELNSALLQYSPDLAPSDFFYFQT